MCIHESKEFKLTDLKNTRRGIGYKAVLRHKESGKYYPFFHGDGKTSYTTCKLQNRKQHKRIEDVPIPKDYGFHIFMEEEDAKKFTKYNQASSRAAYEVVSVKVSWKNCITAGVYPTICIGGDRQKMIVAEEMRIIREIQ